VWIYQLFSAVGGFMKKSNKILFDTILSIFLITVFIQSCSYKYNSEVSNNQSDPSLTPSSLPRRYPLNTNTPTQNIAETPTRPISSPTSSLPLTELNEDGPWLVFTSGTGVWVANDDGTALQQLKRYLARDYYKLSVAVSEQTGLIAITEPSPESYWQGGGYPSYPETDLFLIQLPYTKLQVITPLIATEQVDVIASIYLLDILEYLEFGTPAPFKETATYQLEQVKWAVSGLGDQGNLAWSPDGTMLAFTAAINGPSSDLYTYSVNSGQIFRHTTGLTQVVDPEWSPDGRYIIHKTVNDHHFGAGTIPTFFDGLWAAAADGSELIRLAQGHMEIVGWLSNTHLVITKEWGDAYYDLSVVDITTGVSSLIWQGPYYSTAIDSTADTILLVTDLSFAEFPDWYAFSRQGIYRLSGDDKIPERLEDGILSEHNYRWDHIEWSTELNSFIVMDHNSLSNHWPHGRDPLSRTGYDKALIVTASGSISRYEYEELEYPGLSPDGGTWARIEESGIRVAQEGVDDIYISGWFCNAVWHPDRPALIISDDNTIYLAESPHYIPVEVSSGFSHLCTSSFYWISP
jgi:hypothetical protein